MPSREELERQAALNQSIDRLNQSTGNIEMHFAQPRMQHAGKQTSSVNYANAPAGAMTYNMAALAAGRTPE